MNDSFLDTNVLLYVVSQDAERAGRVETLLTDPCTISVQVLNEIANVARRKMRLDWRETWAFLDLVRGLTSVCPVTLETHDEGMRLAARYQFSVYDSMIVAAALLAGCTTLWSEDMQDGMRIDDRLTIRNPFAVAPIS
jgi:predicted nucleic acid-binding protein